MADISQQIQTCSYKGVKLLVTEIKTDFGQKTALHNFASGDNVSVDDLGRMPERFMVRGIFGEGNYQQELSDIKRIFSEGGVGDFTGWTQGTFSCKVLGKASISENQANLGQGFFSVTLQVVEDSQITAAPAPTTSQSLVQVANSTQNEVEAVTEALDEVAETVATIEEKRNKLQEFADKAKSVTDKIRDTSGKVNQFRAKVDFIRSRATNIIRSPIALANNIRSTVDSIRKLADTPSTALRAYTSLFDFGVDDIFGSRTSRNSIRRDKGLQNMNAAINAGVALRAYQSLSEAIEAGEIRTNQQLGEFLPQVEAQLNLAIENYQDLQSLQALEERSRPAKITALRPVLKPNAGILTQGYEPEIPIANGFDVGLSGNVQNVSGLGATLENVFVDDGVSGKRAVSIDGVVVKSQTSVQNPSIQAVIDGLMKVRSDFRDFLNANRGNIGNEVVVNLPHGPVNVLSYTLYGTEELIDILLELNLDRTPYDMGGRDVKVISG